MSHSLITLTTDFGTGSPYVAQIKAAILSLDLRIPIVDITHAIAAQDIRAGARVLEDVCHRFPAGTIHVAVVDPGVGTERALVYVRLGAQQFLAPDNGLLTFVARHAAPSQLIRLANRDYWSEDVSPTFHGRDILAPVAAHLSLGLDPSNLGPPHDRLVRIDLPQLDALPWGIRGTVIAVDSFGNLTTNIESAMLPEGGGRAGCQVCCRGRTIDGLIAAYGQRAPGSTVALIGSGGRLEIAVVDGSAAVVLGAREGDEVVVRVPQSPHSAAERVP